MARWPWLLSLVLACHSDPSRPTAAGPRPPDGNPAVVGPQPVRPDAPPAPASPPAMRGAAHFAQITQVAVSSDGTAALSRDSLNGVRLWPSLDGRAEPRIVDVTGPTSLAVERRGDGVIAALVDSAGGGHLVELTRDGALTDAPVAVEPAVESVALEPGGDRALVVATDHRLWLVDHTGYPQGVLDLRAGQLAAPLISRGGELRALVRVMVKGKPGAALMVLDATKGLVEARRIGLPIAVAPGVAVASLSPDARRIGYVGLDAAGGSPRLVVADLTTGAEIPVPDAPAIGTLGQVSLGWTTTSDLAIGTASGGWRVAIGDHAEVFATAQSPRQTVPAFGGDATVAGYGADLTIQRGDAPLAFLGYAELTPTAASVAPSGDVVYWISQSGAVVREYLDGTRADQTYRVPSEWHGSIAAVDDHVALVGRSTGVLALVDVDRGVQLATLPVSSSTPGIQYSAARKLAMVTAQPGVVWVVPVDPSSAHPLGKPMVVADGAQTAALVDDGDEVLITYDAQWRGRAYTLRDLQAGVTAAQAKRDRWAAQPATMVSDRAGRSYTLDGTQIGVYRRGVKERTITVEPIQGLAVSPDGRWLAVTSATGAIVVYDASGKRQYALAVGTVAFGTAWSSDGRTMAIAAQGGALVIDADAGTPRLTRCGWKFGLDTQVPSQFPQNVAAVCR